jgi:ADP-heptose:LPS heptosyltransferase
MPHKKSTGRNSLMRSRVVLLKIPRVFRLLGYFRKPQKRVLVIRTDAIGDYILFRNFIEEIKRSEKFSNYRIDLLGNELWEDIALAYDAPFVDSFIFCDPKQLVAAPREILNLGWRLFLHNYDTVLQPTYTRTLLGDGLAALTGCRNIIGFSGDDEGIPPIYKAITNKFYRRLIGLPADIYFEFDRARIFFEAVLGEKINVSRPYLPDKAANKKGILIFPGAGVFGRRWEIEKILELINRIIANTTRAVTLVGGPGELEAGEFLMRELPPGSVKNLIGKTSLTELIREIAGAELLISNETSAIHIAAAVGTKSICILGGGHFERFAPYPKNMQNSVLCLFEKMPCFNCNWQCIYKPGGHDPFPCVSAVSTEKVWNEVKTALNICVNYRHQESLQTGGVD